MLMMDLPPFVEEIHAMDHHHITPESHVIFLENMKNSDSSDNTVILKGFMDEVQKGTVIGAYDQHTLLPIGIRLHVC